MPILLEISQHAQRKNVDRPELELLYSDNLFPGVLQCESNVSKIMYMFLVSSPSLTINITA
jgi:hypothetical protein